MNQVEKNIKDCFYTKHGKQWSLDTISGIKSSLSEDPDRQVGCYVVYHNGKHTDILVGSNRFTEGIEDKYSKNQKPSKYKYIEHAERYLIAQAAKKGVSLLGAIMYMEWFPCVECARMISLSGIKYLYCNKPDLSEEGKWNKITANEILISGGVELIFCEDLN